jgi:hypothetical protein
MKSYTPNEYPEGRGHIECARCFTPMALEARQAVWEAEKDTQGRSKNRAR